MAKKPVRKTSVDKNKDVEIDALTAAFLQAKIDQHRNGQLKLDGPYTANELKKKYEAEWAEVRKRIIAAGLPDPFKKKK